jgi:hypothetical protein
MKKRGFILLLSLIIFILGIVSVNAATYCGGLYNAELGDWVVTSEISCTGDSIPVNGSLIINDNSQVEVSEFDSSILAVHDLRNNNGTIVDEAPDGLNTTPSTYTNDWDPGSREFYIIMNESEHQIQIYSDIKTTDDFLIGIDIDDNQNSGTTVVGSSTGSDLVLGYYGAAGGYVVASQNSTLDDIQAISSGETIDTTYDVNLNNNYTVYFNRTGTIFEIVVNVTGEWKDKLIEANDLVGNTAISTRFKNTTAITGLTGNLTLDNVLMNVSGNVTVSGGRLVINYSNITMTSNQTRFIFNSGTSGVLNNSNFSSSIVQGAYWMVIANSDIIMNNLLFDDLGQSHDASESGLNIAGSGGTYQDLNFGSNILSDQGICLRVLNSASNIVLDNINAPGSSVTGDLLSVDVNPTNTIIRNSNISELGPIFSTNNIFENLILYNLEFSTYNAENSTFLNTTIANEVTDSNSSDYVYYIFNNTNGEMWWYLNNITTAPALVFGTNPIINNNSILYIPVADSHFNTTSRLRFYDLGWTTAQICDEVGGSATNCQTCNSTINCSYSSGTGILEVNVTDFNNNYTTNGTSGTPNTAPNVTISLSPATAYINNTLTTTVNYTDSESDTGTVYFDWFVNGTQQYANFTSGITADTNVSATLNADNFTRWSNVTVQVTPNDGTVNGTSVNASINISNTPASNVIAFSSSIYYASSTLNATINYTDNDGDIGTVYFDWWVDGSSVQAGSPGGLNTNQNLSDILTPGPFSKWQNVTVQAVPFDGAENGTAVNISVNISNIPPNTDTQQMTITPSTIYTNITLNATAVFLDGDTGDVGTLYFELFTNDVWQFVLSPGGVTFDNNASALFYSGNFSKWQNATIQVTPNDGTINGTAINISINVTNSLPYTNATDLSSLASGNCSTSNLNGSWIIHDEDTSDVQTFYLDWFVESNNTTGINYSEIVTSITVGDNTSRGLTIGNFTINDNVTLQITPNDGVGNGTTINTTKITILECASGDSNNNQGGGSSNNNPNTDDETVEETEEIDIGPSLDDILASWETQSDETDVSDSSSDIEIDSKEESEETLGSDTEEVDTASASELVDYSEESRKDLIGKSFSRFISKKSSKVTMLVLTLMLIAITALMIRRVHSGK